MQKSPEYDAKYDPVVRKSKDMQISPEFDALYDTIRVSVQLVGH